MSEASAVSVKISGAKDDINYNPPHNDKPISLIEISLDEKYLVTYSLEDNSIFGWSIDKGNPTPDNYRYDVPKNDEIKKMSVSDDKKLAYTYGYLNYTSRIGK